MWRGEKNWDHGNKSAPSLKKTRALSVAEREWLLSEYKQQMSTEGVGREGAGCGCAGCVGSREGGPAGEEAGV